MLRDLELLLAVFGALWFSVLAAIGCWLAWRLRRDRNRRPGYITPLTTRIKPWVGGDSSQGSSDLRLIVGGDETDAIDQPRRTG